MIHVSETLSIHSVEHFLTHDETEELNDLMDAAICVHGRQRFDADRRTTIHEIPGCSPAKAQRVYEPAGRVEMTTLPQPASKILDVAIERQMPAIVRALPSVTGHRPWIFLEYGPGQHITAHADGIAPDPLTLPRQIAAASVSLDTYRTGGGFYVETTGNEAMWASERPPAGSGYKPTMRFIHDGADMSSPWFRSMSRTRWSVDPEPGTLVVFGSQLTHGTEPVQVGKVRKFLTLLIAE
ncbi:hypothetical protein ACFO9E_26090 [Streptomyces maoxianensis]|uniref:Fe2OG dioxygenase domain-containing protein n=1 Tax=Streptomyces maoxianensis TaxID=1459942 RepID=A0ABV9GAA8_9ACTN